MWFPWLLTIQGHGTFQLDDKSHVFTLASMGKFQESFRPEDP